jgi:hypothetical protein
LHAAALRVQHPISGEWLAFRSPLPADLEAALRAMAGAYQPPAGVDLLDFYGFHADEADDDLPPTPDRDADA